MSQSDLFRLLPSLDELLRHPAIEALVQREGRSATIAAARAALEQLRTDITAGKLDEAQIKSRLDELPRTVEQRLQQSLAYSLRPVINATGVILHTNLGRAPLSRAALEHVAEVSQGYSNLEFNLSTGERGKRDVHVDRLFAKLLNTAEREVSTIVVNNNAAAVLLALNSLAEGGEVLVSRGELVEIGGSFRIPDVMAKSGAVLREVGTTNRTRIADYESAITDRTKLLLRVHRSNFQIVGFTEQPSLEELVALGRKHNIPVMEDLGSGEIFDLRNVGVRGEPMIADSLRAGVDVVTYSGDKLLGGPQAGMISGDPRAGGEDPRQSAVPRPAGGQDVLCRAGSDAARLSARGLRFDSGVAHDAPLRRRTRATRKADSRPIACELPELADRSCRVALGAGRRRCSRIDTADARARREERKPQCR